MFTLIREMENFDLVVFTKSKHIHKRSKRMEIIYNLIANEHGKICKVWLVDTGHVNGLEVHVIYNNGICLIYNNDSKKLITGLILRPKQVERYQITMTKCMSKKVKKHMQKSYNHINFQEVESMKKIIIRIIILVVTIAFTIPIIGNCDAGAKCHKLTNKEITVNWCNEHYKNYSIKFVSTGKVPKHRASKKVIYVEQINTVSKGGYKGKVTGKKWNVKYPVKVKKGNKRVVFLVYNPRNNACDDVVCMVTCHRIK